MNDASVEWTRQTQHLQYRQPRHKVPQPHSNSLASAFSSACHRYLQHQLLLPMADSVVQHRIVLESMNTIHSLSENPAVFVSIETNTYLGVIHTGIPQLVLIPAPVTTTTFFDLPIASAISCNPEKESGPTLVVGILSTQALMFGSFEYDEYYSVTCIS